VGFPSSLLTRPGSKELGRVSFSGVGRHLRAVGGGSFRVDLVRWNVSATLAGVAPGAYVSLGDSFSAATGAPPYEPSSGACARSPQSYGAIYDQRSPKNTLFIPCSAATTSDLLRVFKGEPPQLDRIPTTAGKVSITIGGNDAKLFDVLSTCIFLGFLNKPCEELAGPEAMTRATAITPWVRATLDAITAAAPEAEVAILEYPNPFPAVAPGDCPGLRNPSLPIGIRGSDAPYLRSLVDAVNGAVADAAGQAGVVFAPTAARFAGHDACRLDSWFGPLTGGIETLHPTAAGNVGMKDALIEAVGLAD
jgi:hypothetical protein